MCMQCTIGASAAVGSASGLRAWLGTRAWAWLTPTALRRVTIALFVVAVVASSVLISGNSATPPDASAPAASLATDGDRR
jgi:hypothetical protein